VCLLLNIDDANKQQLLNHHTQDISTLEVDSLVVPSCSAGRFPLNHHALVITKESIDCGNIEQDSLAIFLDIIPPLWSYGIMITDHTELVALDGCAKVVTQENHIGAYPAISACQE